MGSASAACRDPYPTCCRTARRKGTDRSWRAQKHYQLLTLEAVQGRHKPKHLLPIESGLKQYRRTAREGVTEEWGFVDERDLQNWKGGVVCMTCQHFVYGVDQHCHTIVGCNLRQKQLQQGQHLKKRCKLWAPTWQKEVGLAPEAG